jgi:hypothetical protein
MLIKHCSVAKSNKKFGKQNKLTDIAFAKISVTIINY